MIAVKKPLKVLNRNPEIREVPSDSWYLLENANSKASKMVAIRTRM
jgi:hypothetical protein